MSLDGLLTEFPKLRNRARAPVDGRHVFAEYGPIERRPIVTSRFTEGRKRTEQKETKEISTEVSEGSKGDIRKVAGRCCPTRRGVRVIVLPSPVIPARLCPLTKSSALSCAE